MMMGIPLPPHMAPVSRPWWAFWRKRRYVWCDCSYGAILDLYTDIEATGTTVDPLLKVYYDHD